MSRPTCSHCDCDIDDEGLCGCNPPDSEYEQPQERRKRKTWKQILKTVKAQERSR